MSNLSILTKKNYKIFLKIKGAVTMATIPSLFDYYNKNCTSKSKLYKSSDYHGNQSAYGKLKNIWLNRHKILGIFMTLLQIV